MSEHSIFGETGGAGRRSQPSRGAETRRPNPAHGLFGARLLATDRKIADDDDSDAEDLPTSRN
ncbi:hypothetical protein [Sphingosinicella humi]|uniref:Uncharacterized protein n=1 Tax=Allosphingosinicella humi TaxID=2068657 RepID=A0A2U2J3S0_9SPHN|nr:hypothetical protein [Sphingosinicella humi]PWG02921.1 hypothetical protein DF286_08610 [Sphingosinicella humi]